MGDDGEKADQGQEQHDIKDLGHLVMAKRGKFFGLHDSQLLPEGSAWSAGGLVRLG